MPDAPPRAVQYVIRWPFSYMAFIVEIMSGRGVDASYLPGPSPVVQIVLSISTKTFIRIEGCVVFK